MARVLRRLLEGKFSRGERAAVAFGVGGGRGGCRGTEVDLMVAHGKGVRSVFRRALALSRIARVCHARKGSTFAFVVTLHAPLSNC